MAKGKDAVKDIATAVGLDLTVAPLATIAFRKVWDKITDAAGKKAEQKIGELSQSAKRRLLARVLINMAWDDKKNILFVLKNSRAAYHETERVKEFGEIICDEELDDSKRIDLLKKLNACLPSGPIDESEEGDILLELLNDNGVEQKVEWLREKGGHAVEKIKNDILPAVQEKRVEHGDKAGRALGKATDWLNKH